MTATSSGTGRRRRADTPDGDAVRVDEVAAEVTARLVALPLDYGATVDSIAALLAAEPRNEPHLRAVVAAILTAAMVDPFREVNANQWRSTVPGWVRPPMVGVTVRQLVHARLLVTTGRYVRSTDTKGGNANKFCPIYALNLAALLDAEPVDAAASARGA